MADRRVAQGSATEASACRRNPTLQLVLSEAKPLIGKPPVSQSIDSFRPTFVEDQVVVVGVIVHDGTWQWGHEPAL